jgi:hypothetical protein
MTDPEQVVVLGLFRTIKIICGVAAVWAVAFWLARRFRSRRALQSMKAVESYVDVAEVKPLVPSLRALPWAVGGSGLIIIVPLVVWSLADEYTPYGWLPYVMGGLALLGFGWAVARSRARHLKYEAMLAAEREAEDQK